MHSLDTAWATGFVLPLLSFQGTLKAGSGSGWASCVSVQSWLATIVCESPAGRKLYDDVAGFDGYLMAIWWLFDGTSSINWIHIWSVAIAEPCSSEPFRATSAARSSNGKHRSHEVKTGKDVRCSMALFKNVQIKLRIDHDRSYDSYVKARERSTPNTSSVLLITCAQPVCTYTSQILFVVYAEGAGKQGAGARAVETYNESRHFAEFHWALNRFDIVRQNHFNIF